MKVETLIKFKDLKEEKVREEGEIFIVNKDRFAEINKIANEKGYKDFVKEYKED